MDTDKLDELERVAREAVTRPEVCTPEYSAMRNAQERFSALMTPSLFLALITAARRPDDMVLVPREPTEAMLAAAKEADALAMAEGPEVGVKFDPLYLERTWWHVMLSAAPKVTT
jgi:hypothetical protein